VSDLDVKMQGDKILVLPDPVPETTSGGVIIPDTVEHAIDNMRSGIVIAVGPGMRTLEGDFMGCGTKEDDRVVFHKRVGEPMIINKNAYRCMSDRDVFMVVGPGVTLHKVMVRVPAN
jgi:chaperonin GroES